MKRFLVAAFAAFLLSSTLAFAGDISFSTSDSFSHPGLFPITFTGTSTTNFVGGDFGFGVFSVTACPHASCAGSETFTLTISQTSPGAGVIDLVGTISGTVLPNGFTDLTLLFSSAGVIINGIQYKIPLEESLNFGFTTLNGSVGPSAVPEPSALALLGMGALALAGAYALSRSKSLAISRTDSTGSSPSAIAIE
jgi:hypothetical protein